MRRNFEIQGSGTIVSDGSRHDLHNDYEFSNLEFNLKKDILTLHWDNRHSEKSLQLAFKKISILKMNESEAGYPESERRIVNMIGFAWPDEIDSMSSFIPNLADESYHFLVEFMDGSAIKVFSETVELSV